MAVLTKKSRSNTDPWFKQGFYEIFIVEIQKRASEETVLL